MAGAAIRSARQASGGSAIDEAQGSWTDAFPMVELIPHAAMAERRGGSRVSELIHSLDHQTAR